MLKTFQKYFEQYEEIDPYGEEDWNEDSLIMEINFLSKGDLMISEIEEINLDDGMYYIASDVYESDISIEAYNHLMTKGYVILPTQEVIFFKENLPMGEIIKILNKFKNDVIDMYKDYIAEIFIISQKDEQKASVSQYYRDFIKRAEKNNIEEYYKNYLIKRDGN